MTDQVIVELFCLKGAVMFKDLRAFSSVTPFDDDRTELEKYTDALVDRHLEQIDPSILNDAHKMGEFYRMFYALENDIRDMIATTMEDSCGPSW